MRKTLILFILLIEWISAQAFPFVATSDPDLSTTNWYYLKTEGYFVIASPDNLETEFITLASSSNDYHLWCFVGNEDSGYRLYNRGLGLYLGLGTFHSDDPSINENVYIHTEYQDDTYFNLLYDNYSTYYLFMHAYEDQYGTTLYMDISPWPMAPFSVVLAIKGVQFPDDPTWTRYDANGVGYGFVDGGDSPNPNMKSKCLIDNLASTKYFGNVSNCWFNMKASQDVEVEQYSIVTANDSREQHSRALSSWKLQGSNNYVTWYDIDVREDYPMPLADQQEVVFKVNDNRKFRFFKFKATDAASNQVQIGEVWINKQNHNWSSQSQNITPTCGVPGQTTWECEDCNARKQVTIPPTRNHNYNNGVCSVCGLHENETILLYNGQRVPYFMKAYHDVCTNSGVWPEAPLSWNQDSFDDTLWIDAIMPIASPSHSNGPSSNLIYNSHWYDEYNCYYFRRTFNLQGVNPDATFTFNCIHDDNMIVYVNGSEVINEEGWTATPDNCNWDNSHQSYNIPASVFRAGRNVVAVYIQQNWGGAYFDYELIMSGTETTVLGDVNADGHTNSVDITVLYDYLLNNDASNLVNGDVDGDGHITSVDITAIYNILLGN